MKNYHRVIMNIGEDVTITIKIEDNKSKEKQEFEIEKAVTEMLMEIHRADRRSGGIGCR